MNLANPFRPDDSDPRRERLSALLDDELTAAERGQALDDLARDPAARTDWALWHCVADALRAPELAADHRPGFEQRLMGALAAEPALLAPRALAEQPARWQRLTLPATALAAAAVVLAVVALPLMRPDAAAPTAQVATGPATPAAAPPAVVPSPIAPLRRSPEVETYLAAHGELTRAAGLPNAAPYLRTAVEVPERVR